MTLYGKKQPDANQATDQAITRLKKLQQEFTAAAQDSQRKADDAGAALAVLEDLKRKEQENENARFRLRIAERAAYISGLMAHEKKPHSFTVFVDHTGSMTEKPLNAALDGAAVLAKAAGAKVGLWGSADDVRWVKGDVLDAGVRASFEKKGASSDFRPVVDEMIKTAALNRVEGRPSHFVVIGDGEFHDYPKAKEQLEKLLKGNFRATIDFVVMGRSGTTAEFMAENLAKEFPGKIKHHFVSGPGYWQGTEADLSREVQETVSKVATERVRPALKPKAAPTPKPAPQP